RRRGIPVGRYPVALIGAAVALSLAGQFAEAKPGVSGWLISAVPALGFLALIKLVLSTPPPLAGREESTRTTVLSGASTTDTEENAPTTPTQPPSVTAYQPSLLPVAAEAFTRTNHGGGAR